MANEESGNNNVVFVYMGGDQEVPTDVTHVRVHKSVKIITANLFQNCYHLMSIEMHDGVEIIKEYAFSHCCSLRGIKLPGVRVIEKGVFYQCNALADVDFGNNNKLETIGEGAFDGCYALTTIEIPKVRVIEGWAFYGCKQLTAAKFSEDLQTIGPRSFEDCECLQRITIPLKVKMFGIDPIFHDCYELSQVNVVGGIHKTISSLLLQSWRNEMNDEIDRINQVLPNTGRYEKTAAIRRWNTRVLERIEHYKSEHYALLKEDMTQLELALWKANLHNEEEMEEAREQPTKKAKIDRKTENARRQEQRITSGASIVIKNVLPFLKLE